MNDNSKQLSTQVGPPAVWSEWPRTLERAARRLRVTALPCHRDRRWGLLVSRAVLRWSACIEREPVRVYGVGAALAFVCGVLIGLL